MTGPAADEPHAPGTATPVPRDGTVAPDGATPPDETTPLDGSGSPGDATATDGTRADASDRPVPAAAAAGADGVDGVGPTEHPAAARPEDLGDETVPAPSPGAQEDGAQEDDARAPADDGAIPPAEPAPDQPERDDPSPTGHDEPPATRVVDVPRPGAWTTLGRAMRPSASKGQLLAAALCALLGFALVVQLRQSDESQLGSLRQNDLVRLLDETTTRADELSREAAELERERDDLVSGTDSQQAALDAARRNATTQGILTGRLPAVGPGVRITLTETSGPIRPVTMLHVLEELRNAGAEAVQINDTRVVASSAFTGTAGEVVLDGALLEPPYRWLVIGDPDTMATALEIPGGAIAAVRLDGGSGSVEQLEDVEVDAVVDVPEPQYATPVPVEGS